MLPAFSWQASNPYLLAYTQLIYTDTLMSDVYFAICVYLSRQDGSTKTTGKRSILPSWSILVI